MKGLTVSLNIRYQSTSWWSTSLRWPLHCCHCGPLAHEGCVTTNNKLWFNAFNFQFSALQSMALVPLVSHREVYKEIAAGNESRGFCFLVEHVLGDLKDEHWWLVQWNGCFIGWCWGKTLFGWTKGSRLVIMLVDAVTTSPTKTDFLQVEVQSVSWCANNKHEILILLLWI